MARKRKQNTPTAVLTHQDLHSDAVQVAQGTGLDVNGIKTEKDPFEGSREKLDSILINFMKTVAKSKIAVIIPLYGYWSDLGEDNPLNITLFKEVMDRVYSSAHEMFSIIVAEDKRLSSEVYSSIAAKATAGVYKGISVPTSSTYADYVRAGLDAAYTDTDARFFIVLNPWVLIQHNAIDNLIDRINRGDAKIVSGADVKGILDADNFDAKIFNTPAEQLELNADFWGLDRQTYECISLDTNLNTSKYFSRDIWNSLYRRNMPIISTQRIPIYAFELNWENFEAPKYVETDRELFIAKWGFDIA